MIRYYFDTNIYQLIKSDRCSYNQQLHQTCENSKNKLLFIFSDAHLEDLKNSRNPYRDEDLLLMGDYTKDNYFSVDIHQDFKCYLADPITAFYGKDYEAVDDFFANPSKLTNLFDLTSDVPGIGLLEDTFNTLLQTPLNSIAPMPDLDTMGNESKEWLLKFLPEYSADMTLKQFWNNNMTFSIKFKDNKDELRAIRKFVEKTFNSKEYTWNNWKTAFNIRLKKTKLNKTFLEIVDSMLLNNQKNQVYRKITLAYNLLEILNITQERSGGKAKQFTFTSLNQDAKHVFYAAYADYLVTDDRGMQLKAFIIYDLLNIPTQVLSVEDFISQNHQIQFNEESYSSFILAINHDLKHAFELSSNQDITSDKLVRTYKTIHSYFNYFNRIQIVNDRNSDYGVLYCERRSPANFILFRENELLVNKLLNTFGIDDDKKGIYQFNQENLIPLYRRWTIGEIKYELKTVEGYICLYFDQIV